MARGEERPGSDIDFLVELAPDARPIEILSIGVELEDLLRVKVDVGTPTAFRERLRDEVLAEAVTALSRQDEAGLHDVVDNDLEPLADAVQALLDSTDQHDVDARSDGDPTQPGP